MKEQGVITRILSSKLAEVAFQRSSACAKCRACHGLGEGMVGIEAENEAGAKRDDIVEIEVPSGEMIKGSMVVFLMPILFLAVGYLMGAYLMRLVGLSRWEEGVGIVLGISAMFLSYFAIRWYDRNIAQKEALRARITKIVSSR
ncbi:MAG: SoxR reducing system RseC family protein [Candidatus Margulisiibacteriota bacterium]